MLDIDWPPRNSVFIKVGMPTRTMPGMEQETDSQVTDSDEEEDNWEPPQPNCERRQGGNHDDRSGGRGGGLLVN